MVLVVGGIFVAARTSFAWGWSIVRYRAINPGRPLDYVLAERRRWPTVLLNMDSHDS